MKQGWKLHEERYWNCHDGPCFKNGSIAITDSANKNEAEMLMHFGVVDLDSQFETFTSRFHYTLMIGRMLRALPIIYDLGVLGRFIAEELREPFSDRAHAVLALVAACDPVWLRRTTRWMNVSDGPMRPFAESAWNFIAGEAAIDIGLREFAVDRLQTDLPAFHVGPSWIGRVGPSHKTQKGAS